MDKKKKENIFMGFLCGAGAFLIPIYFFETILSILPSLFLESLKIKTLFSMFLIILFISALSRDVFKINKDKLFRKTYLIVVVFSLAMYLLRILLILYY